MRGLRAEILTSTYHSPGDKGISATHFYVTIVGPNVPERDEVVQIAPAVEIGETAPGCVVLHPLGAPESGRVGWMASGAYVIGNAEEWRKLFGHPLPLPLHDRSEVHRHVW